MGKIMNKAIDWAGPEIVRLVLGAIMVTCTYLISQIATVGMLEKAQAHTIATIEAKANVEKDEIKASLDAISTSQNEMASEFRSIRTYLCLKDKRVCALK